ncbi:hypothetical protein [Streptomyces sp. bgisy034]|uniref:hypothetical protein n=1 Tax=Streptomyces sp. bgisy034 TaxID=3413774 RepID=UPI003EBC490D
MMAEPEPTLAERITAAEQAGNWTEARQLKAAMAVDLSSRADHNGRIRPVSEAAPAESPGQPQDTPAKPARTPIEQLRPGALPSPPEPTRAERIAAFEQSGDFAAAGRLKAEWLAERAEEMNGGSGW